MKNKIVLFDGECNFCDSSVQFIIQRDPQGVFSFASLQSETGKELLKAHQLPLELSSIVLIDEDVAHTKSTAALRIAKQLKGMWKLSYLFIIIPRPLRNFFYDIIAANRYKWFGKKKACEIPPPHIRRRFI